MVSLGLIPGKSGIDPWLVWDKSMVSLGLIPGNLRLVPDKSGIYPW